MSQRQSGQKRTRSAKGLALDQEKEKGTVSSPEPKERRVSQREKSKASRKIIFSEEVNANSNAASIVGGATKANVIKQDNAFKKGIKVNTTLLNRGKKLMHPCFQNVMCKEQLALKKQKQLTNKIKDKCSSSLQDSRDDGIQLNVEADFVDLDYIDDMADTEVLSETEDLDQIQLQSKNAGNEVPQRSSPLATKDTRSGRAHAKRATKTTHDKVQNQPIPSTSAQNDQNQVDKLTDAELANLPRVKNLFNQFWEEKMKEMDGKGKNRIPVDNCQNKIISVSKLPSDTTIYAPALICSSPQRSGVGNGEIFEPRVGVRNGLEILVSEVVNGMVSEFVDNVRLEQQNRQHDMMQLQEIERRKASRDNTETSPLEEARERGNKAQLEVETFRATVAQPKPGMDLNSNNRVGGDFQQIPNIGSGVSDDDFFHLTCHIDPNLIHKIEKGEFVELEKLIPKEKFNQNDDNRLEWVQRDRGTFLVPAQTGTKIGSFRKWEQAFRAYATIYCGANPHRSKEIWQYISVINTAASSFIWDNVYNYDITFRHLMAFNPQRPWSVCYNQMWNLSMRDPLPKNANNKFGGNNFHSSANGSGGSKTSNNNNSNNNGFKKKPDYCWNFNKEVPCKFGARCKYIERCKYCDSAAYGVISCPKLFKKQGNNKPVQETKKAN